MNETNAGGVRRRWVEIVVPVPDRGRGQRQHRRHLAGGEGPGTRPQAGVVPVHRRCRRLHGRGPVDGAGGLPPPGRPAPLRPQRPRDRQPAAPAGRGGAGRRAGVRVPLVQPAAEGGARGPLLGRAVRVQGHPHGRLPGARPAYRGHRLDRRPRQPRRHRAHRPRRPQGHGPDAARHRNGPYPHRRTRIAVPRRTSTPQVPAARTTIPAVLPTGANTHLEYAS